MRLTLDTYILAYAEGVNGSSMKKAALYLVEKLPQDTTFLPVQVLGELFNLLVRKAGRTRASARAAILSWRDVFPLVETSAAVMLSASDLATNHKFTIWDAVVLSAAAAAGSRLLLSEDLQSGFTWQGVTVTNPFSRPKHELLSALLDEAAET
jgi:predicted nucleic acid-binding protein